MNYAKLKELIDSEPANAGKTDVDVHTWVLEDDPAPDWIDIPAHEFRMWLGENNGALRLETEKANGANTDQTRNACALSLAMINSSEDIFTSEQRVRQVLNQLVPEVFTGAEAQVLLDVARPAQKRWEKIGGIAYEPLLTHITTARAM